MLSKDERLLLTILKFFPNNKIEQNTIIFLFVKKYFFKRGVDGVKTRKGIESESFKKALKGLLEKKLARFSDGRPILNMEGRKQVIILNDHQLDSFLLSTSAIMRNKKDEEKVREYVCSKENEGEMKEVYEKVILRIKKH